MKVFDIAARIIPSDPSTDATTISAKLRPLLSAWGPVNFAVAQRDSPSLELVGPNAMITVPAEQLSCLQEVAKTAEEFLLNTLGIREQRRLMEALNRLQELVVENETESRKEPHA